jgi:hypothetical protein
MPSKHPVVERIVYAQVNDANNIAITGQNANQIVASRAAAAAAAAGTRKRPPTRDLFQTEELIELASTQEAKSASSRRQVQHVQAINCSGDTPSPER